MRTFEDDLQEELKNPEFAAYFAEAQIESAQELLRCGVISSLTVSSLQGKHSISTGRLMMGIKLTPQEIGSKAPYLTYHTKELRATIVRDEIDGLLKAQLNKVYDWLGLPENRLQPDGDLVLVSLETLRKLIEN